MIKYKGYLYCASVKEDRKALLERCRGREVELANGEKYVFSKKRDADTFEAGLRSMVRKSLVRRISDTVVTFSYSPESWHRHYSNKKQ